MHKYKTIKPISLVSGEVGLTDEQYKRRKLTRSLEPIKGGLYRIVGRVNFKAGEIFTYSERLKIQAVEEIKQPEKQAKGKD